MSLSYHLPSHAPLLLALLAATGACASDSEEPTPRAIVTPDRSEHLLDRPFPSDELLTDEGTVDLEGFPVAGTEVGQNLIRGWTNQIRGAVFGFSAMTPIYFRFSEPLRVDSTYASEADDPIGLRSLDSGHRVTVRTTFVEDGLGDPFLPMNTLVVTPDERTPLRSGERYIAWVDRSLADPADGWTPPPEAETRDLAVATVFTVQDHIAELRSLRDAVDAEIDADGSILAPDGPLRPVDSVRYEQGETPSGEPATVEIVTFSDGETERTYLDDKETAEDRTIDLTGGPYAVYQGTIEAVVFQDAEGKPWQSPGLGFVDDWDRTDGWMHFDAEHQILDAPHREPLRVVIQVPRTGADFGVVTWSHGSGGDAYEAINRVNQEDEILRIREALADAGAIIVSADMPVFGQRSSLIDDGYSSNAAFINVANLVPFRDNARQAAAEHRLLYRFVTEQLPTLFEEGVVDPSRVGAFGHSTGSQVVPIAGALHGPDAGLDGLLQSGAGGFISEYILATDLLELGGETSDAIFLIAGIDAPENVTPQSVLGAIFGIPEVAWNRIDRHHPLLVPFQLVLDGADPLALAPRQPVPATIFLGVGDRRAPNDSARWVADAMPDAEIVECTPEKDYDPHYCALREEGVLDVFRGFVESLGGSR